MHTPVHILVIEDEAVLAMTLSDKLEAEGYTVIGIANNGAKALSLFTANSVDLVLSDIQIKGPWDGIETVRQLVQQRPVPVIYLTAYADSDTITRAKQTYPAAYLAKPFDISSLRLAIDLAIHNFVQRLNADLPTTKTINGQHDVADRDPARDPILQVNDQLFLKQGYQFVKVNLVDIVLLEADNIYTTFVTSTRKYALRLPLTSVLEKLPAKRFVRVHRSYAVNVSQVDTFSDHEVTLGKYSVPMSKNFKDEFIHRLRAS
ncbi:response regulator [Fibrella sp. HMF5335]|uniref:Response regulator n=1 Tax=Fibrella rubiginis TaxID=2817060 RepID=A0A939GJW3_9BACT|nr:response regulator [Fibrella rubiginis]MBO0937788.1 response regulator [Fibrella rubiginis]